jgi:hypothetical protein
MLNSSIPADWCENKLPVSRAIAITNLFFISQSSRKETSGFCHNPEFLCRPTPQREIN